MNIMKILVIAILVTLLMIGTAVWKERKDDIKSFFRRKFNNDDNKTEYQKHLERGGKDYRKK